MYTLYKCCRSISIRKIETKLIRCCYFLAEKDEFVKQARALEKLKKNDSLPPNAYEEGKYILFLNSDLVCLKEPNKLSFKSYKELQELKKDTNRNIVLLDFLITPEAQFCLFGVNLKYENEPNVKDLESKLDVKLMRLRESLFFLSREESKYVAHARGLFNFCQTCNFCSYCGEGLKLKEGGLQKQCPKCNRIHYPQLTPIGLTLVEDEAHEEVLLIHQQRHPPNLYSCVAGFIEPGESLEDNVRREVAEEVGLSLIHVEYCLSQHWALPNSQLTLGCIGTTRRKDMEIDLREVLHAKWVKAEDLMKAIVTVRGIKDPKEVEESKITVPPPNALSHNLMVTWLTKYHNFKPS